MPRQEKPECFTASNGVVCRVGDEVDVTGEAYPFGEGFVEEILEYGQIVRVAGVVAGNRRVVMAVDWRNLRGRRG